MSETNRQDELDKGKREQRPVRQEDRERDEHDRAAREAVQGVIDDAAATRKKYGHPEPDVHERTDAPTMSFIRWFEKGGHLDPAEEAHNAEYDALWKKHGGGRDEITLDDGTTVRRSRAPEDPEPARGTSGLTEDARTEQPQDHIPSEYGDGDPHADGENAKPDEPETKKAPAPTQGLTKANTPTGKSTSTSKTAKS